MRVELGVGFARFEHLPGHYSHVLDMKIAKIFLLAPLALANKNSFLSGKRAENKHFLVGDPVVFRFP